MNSSQFNDQFLPDQSAVRKDFEVPADYFKKLPETVMQHIAHEDQPKISKGRSISMLVRWAAAAVLIAGVTATIYLSQNGKKPGNAQPQNELALSNSEWEYLHLNDVEVITIMEATDDEEWIMEYMTQEASELEIINE